MSSKLLIEAIEKPSNYTDLVVRRGGYSIYFNQLSAYSKNEFVERVERGEIVYVWGNIQYSEILC